MNNRVALLDLADSPDADTLIAAAATDRALDDARFGAAFAPWAVVPGVASGTTRTVPWSAVQAGMIARLESSGKTSNVPAAGVNGQSQYAVGLSQVGWSDADRESLNDGGVNVVIQRGSDIRTYGYRTLVDPATPEWIWFGNARLYMQIASDLNAVGERFVLAEIDGRGKIIHEFGGELIAALIPYWEAGSLYGENATDAFRVDIGSQVNTPETIAAGELHAVAEVRMSPDAERVQIEVVKIANTEAV